LCAVDFSARCGNAQPRDGAKHSPVDGRNVAVDGVFVAIGDVFLDEVVVQISGTEQFFFFVRDNDAFRRRPFARFQNGGKPAVVGRVGGGNVDAFFCECRGGDFFVEHGMRSGVIRHGDENIRTAFFQPRANLDGSVDKGQYDVDVFAVDDLRKMPDDVGVAPSPACHDCSDACDRHGVDRFVA